MQACMDIWRRKYLWLLNLVMWLERSKEICESCRTVHGLKSNVMLGYKQSYADHTSSVKKDWSGTIVPIAYVSDIIATSELVKEFPSIKEYFSTVQNHGFRSPRIVFWALKLLCQRKESNFHRCFIHLEIEERQVVNFLIHQWS